MKKQNISEMVVKEDTSSKRAFEGLQEDVRRTNDFLAYFESQYNIKFTDEDLQVLPNLNYEKAQAIARRYYSAFPPEMRAQARQELILALINQPIGEKSVMNALKWFRESRISFDSDRLKRDFIEVKGGRFVIKSGTLERLQEHFTKKIAGENLNHYYKAKQIEKLMQELFKESGLRFIDAFDSGLYGEVLTVKEMNFVSENEY